MRVGHVGMAEIGGQNRQKPLWILLGLIPAQQRICGEDVPHVVQTRAVAVINPAQANPPGQSIERSMNITYVEAITPIGGEQIRRRRQGCVMSMSAFNQILQHRACCCVHRHETGLSELRAADRQNHGFEIDVRELEVPGLAEAQAGHAEQSEWAVVCQRPEFAAGIMARHLECGGQEPPDVVL